MDKKFWNVLISLVVVLAIFVIAALVLSSSFDIRFLFVGLALILAFVVYYVNKDNKAWEVGTRQVVWMAIGAALYAIFSWLFNGTVFVVPSLSQVALRPAIAIPMFFGYAFGPVVGFFSGAIGNVFGDAISGFGLSPQWSIGNGLIGFVAGLWMLFSDKKRSMDTVMWISGACAVLGAVLFFFNRNVQNQFYFAETQPVSLLAGISILIGFVLVLVVRFAFGSNIDLATAVTWGMLGNIVGILFASLSDIWVDGFSPTAAIVGEFLPAAGPNLIFAAILVPLLVVAYASVQRQSGR